MCEFFHLEVTSILLSVLSLKMLGVISIVLIVWTRDGLWRLMWSLLGNVSSAPKRNPYFPVFSMHVCLWIYTIINLVCWMWCVSHIRPVFSDWCLSLGELSINVNGMLGPLLLFFLSSSPFMSINLFLMCAPLLGAYVFITLLYFLHGSIDPLP